jgi:hypothetical protein
MIFIPDIEARLATIWFFILSSASAGTGVGAGVGGVKVLSTVCKEWMS